MNNAQFSGDIDILSPPLLNFTKLSEISDGVSYIPLQTMDKCLIRYVYDIKNYKNNFIIFPLRQVLCFSNPGDFLYKLDKEGRGPEEYTGIYDFDISSENNLLVISVSKRIIFYSITKEGFTYLESIKLLRAPSNLDFVPGQKCLLLSYGTEIGLEPYRNVLINLDGDTLDARPNYYQYKKLDEGGASMLANANLSFTYCGKLHFKDMYSDTVFTIDHSNKIKPYLILNSHGNNPNPQYMADWRNVFINYADYIQFTSIMEVTRYFIYKMSYQNSDQIVFFDKSLSKKFGINSKTFLQDYIKGGVNFEPKFCSEGKLFSWVDALTLKKYVASEDFAKARVQDPKKKEELKALAENLNETDNPVLIIVTPKK